METLTPLYYNGGLRFHGALDLRLYRFLKETLKPNFKEGTEEVHEGTEEVQESTTQVHEGTAQVNEGTAQVNEGTAEVNESTATVCESTASVIRYLRTYCLLYQISGNT
ncbi:hypothetical protein Tco_1361261 [Tanacetum coccineum]